MALPLGERVQDGPEPSTGTGVGDDRTMGRCLELARAAAGRGNQPYGSVIVLDGRVVAEGENSVTTDVDSTAHAEIVAIRRACRALGRVDLTGATIYASGEACSSSAAAIRGAGPSLVVFATPRRQRLGGCRS